MTIRSLARAAASTLVLLVGLTLGTAAAQDRPAFVSIGTASPAGAYYPLGVAMADLWNRAIDGVEFSSQETGGSVANMNLIHAGDIELGIANENIAWNATEGNEPFAGPLDVQGGWVLNASQGVFVAPRDGGLADVTDLAGNRIGILRATVRHFAKFVTVATGLIGFFMAVFTRKRQTLHDLIAGCLVIARQK